MDFRAARFEIKAIEDGGIITGYASVFGETDSYGDIVEPGAFKAAISAFNQRGNRGIPILLEHDPDQKVGAWKVIEEDTRGLRVEGKLLVDDIPAARAAHALLKEGAFDGLSIGYYARKWSYDEEADIRHLQEIDLREVSLVFNPALASARVEAIKAADVPRLTSTEIAQMDEKSLRAELEQRITRNAGLPRSVTRCLLKGGLAGIVTRNADADGTTKALMQRLLTELKKGA